jgi:iron complex outermembrane receptor protein
MSKLNLMVGVAVCGLWAGFGAAQAQPSSATTDVESVTVTGDAAHLIETVPNSTAFGLSMSLIDTPRAITVISDTTIARYGITGVNALTAITPSAYTASFYGVEGAVNLRGTLAENYFRGFKRVENRGTYSTPIGDASQIEILRGPPSPIYGAGKVGGLLNFIPKTAQTADGFLADVTGGAEVTLGSYGKHTGNAQIGAPLDLGFAHGGVYAYGELDDSDSFYRGIHPSHQLLEASADLDLGNGYSFSGDYMYYHSNGDVQTPGWNRLTQDLIDNGNYQAGRDTSLTDADGNGRLTLNELGGNPYFFSPAFKALYQIAFSTGGTSVGCSPNFNCIDATHTLDTGIATVKLSRRTVYIAPGIDFSNTFTHTGFLQFGKSLGDLGDAKLETFYDSLKNDRFVSYGFPASYRSEIYEGRLSDTFGFDMFNGAVQTQTVAGASYRYTHGIGKESFNSGVIALDRRDISYGATANDIIDSPFNVDPAGSVGLGWENDVRTNTNNAGAFLTSSAAWNNFNLILGGRFDDYAIRSVDKGVLAYEAAAGAQHKDMFTYSASLNYKTPWGLVPYGTFAKNAAIEIGQADQVATSLLVNKAAVSASYLTEGGVKFAFLDDHLVGSVSYYRQERTRLATGGGVVTVVGTRSKGEELELRYVADQNWSFTFAGSMQHTIVKGPDTSFVYLPARTAGVSGLNGFGGTYVSFNFSTFPGPATNYEYTLIPHAVISPYLTYTADPFDWGVVGGTIGFSYVTKTAQYVPNPIIFPSYVTANASAFVKFDTWEVDVNVNNLADERYFTPDADSYANLGALPGKGREFRFTVKKTF